MSRDFDDEDVRNLARLALARPFDADSIGDHAFGFFIATGNEEDIATSAREEGVTLTDVDWDMISFDFRRIEMNMVQLLRDCGFQVRSEGHDGNSDLVGTAWINAAGTLAMWLVHDYLEMDEPFTTTSGSLTNKFGFDSIWGGCSRHGQRIDVSLGFFGIPKELEGYLESLPEHI